jgi:hypothetical protein
MPIGILSAALAIVPMIALLSGCGQAGSANSKNDQPVAPPSTQPQTLVGTLRDDMAAIGGETSGWVLVGDGATGGIELDVSAVQKQAREMSGQRVSVTGMMRDRKYVERGTVRVLAVDSIRPAPAP